MKILNWFHITRHELPEHNVAVYVDLGKNGLRYARLVGADDARILNGCPKTEFMRPVGKGFDDAFSAGMDAKRGLRGLGVEEGVIKRIPVYVEQEDGEVKRL